MKEELIKDINKKLLLLAARRLKELFQLFDQLKFLHSFHSYF